MSLTKSLTHRERMTRAFEHRDQDRVPRHESFWGDTIKRWEGEGCVGGSDHVLELLDSDLYSIAWIWACPFPGQGIQLAEDEQTSTYKDGFGGIVRYFKAKTTTPEHIGWECDSPDAWRKTFRPALEKNAIQVDIEATRKNMEPANAQEKWRCISGVEPFEYLRKQLGDVVSLEAMIEEPEWVAEISEVFTTVTLRNYQALIDAGVEFDGIFTYGDMAFNHSTMCSPAQYRELIWPQHKRLCDWAHSHGMKFIYHTDGDVNGVMDLYMAAGFDSLQPLECKANMDIRNLAPVYGDKISLFGNIDVMKMIPNDLDLIEAEIISKFAAGKATRGYIYHSDHSIPPQVSWKTYQEIIKLVEKHGAY